MRRSLGTAVFSGMVGVTLFGLFLTPVFYVVIRRYIPCAGTAHFDLGNHSSSGD